MTEKKTILILGAGLMQGPAIKAAKELGYNAFVVDGNPDAACVKDADFFEAIDLKDKDSLLTLAKKINKDNNLAAVFTAGTDFSANTAYVANYFNFTGHSYSSCLNASDKCRMREAFKKNGVPSPEFIGFDNSSIDEILKNADELSFPKVIKPVDNMGGRGCRMVRNKSELKSSMENAVKFSRTSRGILEDYMEGAEFSIDSIVHKGTLTITGFADRHIYYPPYFIETGHTLPSNYSQKIKNELIATFALGIKALGLTEGVAKADIKYTKNGPMIGEIAARLSGGYMSGWTFPYASDCFLTKEALLISLGKESEYLLKNRKSLEWQPHESVKENEQPFELFEIIPHKVSAERAWLSIPGKIKKITGLDAALKTDGVKDVLPRVKEGDEVDFPRNNVQKCGNVICVADDFETASENARIAISKITVELEQNNKKTEDFLLEKTFADEDKFPPSAFEFNVSNIEFADIPENKKAADFMPKEFNSILNEKDWNRITLKECVSRFDELYPVHKKIDGKRFWKACLRASIQGMIYVANQNQ